MSDRAGISRRKLLWIVGLPLVAIALIAAEVAWTGPVRGAIRTFHGLITAANRGDLDAARSLCTDRFLREHPLKLAKEGGLVNLPRTMHMNYQAWSEGGEVWICPTKGVGPVYRFVPESDLWKFDGLVGHLIRGGRVVPAEDLGVAGP